MIPMLLWRCPVCGGDDALEHVERRFRAGVVHCAQCGARWRVRRVAGDGFYLALVAGRDGARPDNRDERPLAAWYDAMKATVRLVPRDDGALTTEPGEVLYLASGIAELHAEASDPLFFPSPAARRKVDKREIEGRCVGRGRLFLTSRRLVWAGEGPPHSFPLARLNSAYAVMDVGLALMVERRLYSVHFLQESLLKWVTYLALVARQVEAETGHRIETSHF
ncbi:MAG: hypothetical protein JXA93_17395 [Anaerolineae bacterium]|nr:hypothetical protein [Anaerolineae bacterium]